MKTESWGVGIAGVGAYVPDRVVTNDELEAGLGLERGWIEGRTGILQRHVAAPNQATSDLGAIAARRALAAAGVDAAELSMVIVGTTTPDEVAPATACRLQHVIGASGAVAFDVMAACSGFMLALHTAVTSMGRRNGPVLVVGAEAFSRFVDPADRATAVLFGDGAGAVVVAPCDGRGIEHLSLGSDGSKADYFHIPAGGSRSPTNASTFTDHLHHIAMRGRDLSGYLRGNLGTMLADELRAAGLSSEGVTKLVPHQPNPKLIRALAAEAGFAADRLVLTADLVGNLGAAGIPYSLAHAVTDGSIREGDRLLLAAVGAGLTWASGLLTWGPARADIGRAERPLAMTAA